MEMSEDKDSYRYYIMELGDLLKEYISNAQKFYKERPDDFSVGYSCAIKDLTQSIIKIAEEIDVDLRKDLRIDDIDIDKVFYMVERSDTDTVKPTT